MSEQKDQIHGIEALSEAVASVEPHGGRKLATTDSKPHKQGNAWRLSSVVIMVALALEVVNIGLPPVISRTSVNYVTAY